MLDKFRRAKAGEIARLRQAADAGRLPPAFSGKRPSFSRALVSPGPGAAVIAEYKRASPSRGEINLGLTPELAAEAYARAGAAAMSVLTEERYFKGDLGFLADMSGPGLPLLRKDFLLDPLQVVQTAATPASALLLIARMFLLDSELFEMIKRAERLDLEPVVEVFDRADLNRARRAGAWIIQVNNRDLDSLEVDLDNSRRLVELKEPGETWISASGIQDRGQVLELGGLGFAAVLVGSALMASSDPGLALAKLTGRKQP
ncbi:MAG: indole-3-glycerol-phosphate synthase [Desulfovibrionaceae bacterium]|nr:indole-3-glycerol-phosphate synthase [Desulfovibrionaceae bacterium]